MHNEWGDVPAFQPEFNEHASEQTELAVLKRKIYKFEADLKCRDLEVQTLEKRVKELELEVANARNEGFCEGHDEGYEKGWDEGYEDA